MVALSLGAAGALFVTAVDALYFPALQVDVKSTVGAGDSMVGALIFAIAKNMPLREAAAWAMAAAAGAVTTIGTKPPSLQLVNEFLLIVE